MTPDFLHCATLCSNCDIVGLIEISPVNDHCLEKKQKKAPDCNKNLLFRGGFFRCPAAPIVPLIL